MASVHRDPRGKSQFWYAAFKLPDNTRCFRSTKKTNRKEAQKVADAWEEAARLQTSETQFRRVMQSIWEQISGKPLASSTIKDFLQRWKARKEKEVESERTARTYSDVAMSFLKFLDTRADEEISRLTASDIVKFRDALLERVSPVTANKYIKVLRLAFQDALREHLVSDNPAKLELVGLVKRRSGKNGNAGRRPFKLSELRRLLDIASGEWRGLIFFGLYTGQRLGDIARLTWLNVNVQRCEIAFVTSKTGRQQIIPIAAPLREYMENDLPVSDDPKDSLFPRAHSTVTGQFDRVGTLSNQFYDLMVEAGLVPPRSHAKKGGGRASKRSGTELSFHCLRHTATSLMKGAGIPEAVVRDIIGHDSKAVSANYTHVDEATKVAALEKYSAALLPISLQGS
jgi:integrase